MQWPGLTVGADSIPVIQSKRGVTRLLNLRDHQARSERVNGSGGDKQAVAECRLEAVQAILGLSLDDAALQRRSIDTASQPGINAAARLRMQDDPSLCLAVIGRAEAGRLGIIRMDLDREILLRIEELKQQRELGQRMVAAQQVRTELSNERTEREATQGAGSHATLVVPVVHDFPTFGEVFADRQRFAKDSLEASSAPQVLAIQGLKA
jgi:hypothetical protein